MELSQFMSWQEAQRKFDIEEGDLNPIKGLVMHEQHDILKTSKKQGKGWAWHMDGVLHKPPLGPLVVLKSEASFDPRCV